MIGRNRGEKSQDRGYWKMPVGACSRQYTIETFAVAFSAGLRGFVKEEYDIELASLH